MEKVSYRLTAISGTKKLEEAGVPEASENARLLLEAVCQTKRQDLYLHPERELSPEEASKYWELIALRCKRIPLQQLTGTQCFMGYDFIVNESVLIPRQDTEILVEQVLNDGAQNCFVLDLCSGSGCIPLSIKLLGNSGMTIGCDISKEALSCAGKNAERLNAAVSFYEGDLFEAVPLEYRGSFDIITSNPPYIRSGEIDTLMPEVKDHEPHMALDGGEDGLVFYRRIADEAGSWLKKGGRIYMETGFDQAGDVSRIFEEKGYKEIKVIKDHAGLDRVVACKSGE